jgi:hypothetical protein
MDVWIMPWEPKQTQTDDEWFRELVATVIATPPRRLPPAAQQCGPTTATWFETDPGLAFIHTAGGSPDDRLLAEIIVRNQLSGHGIKQASYTFDQGLTKTADWTDVEAKAKRLIQSGQVQLLRNGAQNIVGHVQGDHGDYQTEISREDPNSRSITQWQCDCPWDQYAWQRTRQWKKYEGRPCAHVLATYWKSLATPLDEDAHPAGQQSLFNVPAGPAPGGGSPFRGPAPAPQGQQMQLPFQNQAPGGMPMPAPGQTPQDPGILPPFPMAPDPTAPVVNPASVPGLRQPSPTNPVQYPGGTFSRVMDWEFASDAEANRVVSAQPSGFQNGNMVSTIQDDWGTLIGRSEDHGSGQSIRVPAGSVGEVLGQDPTTQMVQVLFENKMTEKMGPLEPNGVTAWFFPSELKERPDVRRPGPAVRRQR